MIEPHYIEFVTALISNTSKLDKWKRTSSSNAFTLSLKENTVMMCFYSDSEYIGKKTLQINVMNKQGDDIESFVIREDENEYQQLSDYFQKIKTLSYGISSEVIIKLTKELS